MADIVQRLRFHANSPSLDGRSRPELLQAADEIEQWRAFAQFIIDGYPRIDIDHEDFRVQAYTNALKALDQMSDRSDTDE